MLLSELVQVSNRVASTRSRNAKIDNLAGCIRTLQQDELAVGVPFLAGVMRQGRIGVGYRTVQGTADVPPSDAPRLTLSETDGYLERLATVQGKGSARVRQETLHGLLGRATEPEQTFLRRLLVGELRQGALEALVLEAIAQAAGVEARAVRRAQMVAGDVAEVARGACVEGEAGLARFDLQVFRPILPMLAQTAEDAGQALQWLGGRAAFELKLDGARVQLHKSGNEVRVFSRRLNDVTASVPELVETARGWEADEIVVDGEALALRSDGRPHAFQTTMRRFGRQQDVEAMRHKLPLIARYFDCLYFEGRSLLDDPNEVRVEALQQVVPEAQRVERELLSEASPAARFVQRAIEAGYEGAMAKGLDTPYEAGSRGAGWLKLKEAHTLDLVVLAVEWGSGRRRGTLSNLHLGARDAKSGEYVMLGKTFKGLTDKLLRWQTEALLARETSREGHVVHVRPELVVEIAFSDVQTSPQYPAGLALRFARVKRYREDKSPEQADTLETVRVIHRGERPAGV
jgi:DNA ligase-1